jgi:hypothetical protein
MEEEKIQYNYCEMCTQFLKYCEICHEMFSGLKCSKCKKLFEVFDLKQKKKFVLADCVENKKGLVKDLGQIESQNSFYKGIIQKYEKELQEMNEN